LYRYAKSKGYQIIATTPHTDDCNLEDFDFSKPSALCFGTEKEGLSEEIMQKADGFLKIPMVGFTESLNISVSAAIILQNLTNRLRNSDIPWQLNEAQILEKRLDWAKKIHQRHQTHRGTLFRGEKIAFGLWLLAVSLGIWSR